MKNNNLDAALTLTTRRPQQCLLAVVILSLCVVGVLPASVAKAIYSNTPPIQPGFPQMLTGDAIVDSSPTLADLDGDGKLEIIIGGRSLNSNNTSGCEGWVYAYRSNGTLYWQTKVRAPVNSSPTVADLNGDGKPEVIVGLGGVVETQCWNGGVVALHGQDGSTWAKGAVVWAFDTQDWLNHAPDGWLDGGYSTPAVGDVDGDGQVEVVFGAWDQCIYLLDHNGVPKWGNLPGRLNGTYCGGHGFYNEDTTWSSPALADLDGDGKPEIIIGADITAGNTHGDPNGGYVYVLNGSGEQLARTWLDQTVFSSPAIADLNNDGILEIVVGTGSYWSGTGYYVTAYRYDPAQLTVRTRLVQEWRSLTRGRVFASPAIGDLNGDGYRDVVITSYIGENGANGSDVYAWDGRTGAQLFRTQVCDFWGNSFSTHSSPVLADVDGDGHLEILFSHAWEVEILNHDGTYYTDYSNPTVGNPANPSCARTSAPTTTQTLYAKYSVFASPAVGDLDNNGQIEIVIGGAFDTNTPHRGGLHVWTGFANKARPWAMFRRVSAHTGLYSLPPELTVAPGNVMVLHQIGQTNTEKATLIIQNDGDGSLNWQATAPAGVALQPLSGTVTGQNISIQVTIATAGLGAGDHTLGNITITATSDDGTVLNSPTSVPVKVYVGTILRTFLPSITR